MPEISRIVELNYLEDYTFEVHFDDGFLSLLTLQVLLEKEFLPN